nr:IS5 family transposase [Pseudohalocynthiibacter aestuariivivens]
MWFDLDAVSGWRAVGVRKRGGQRRHSDLAIEICLALRAVFGLALRQVQGFVRSLVRLAGLNLPVPDVSTLCRRSALLKVTPDSRLKAGRVTLIVDSTGLQIHGGRDWMREKHGIKNQRKTWRKLHIGFDPDAGEIVAPSLTDEHVSDPAALPELLAQIAGKVGCFIAAGAYDGAPTAEKIREVLGPDVELIIPPPRNAVMGDCKERNTHIEMITDKGRISWQKATGYAQRSRGEAQIARFKQVIGPELKGRRMETQITAVALNRMACLGRATYEPVV